jgi:hypothetical protein
VKLDRPEGAPAGKVTVVGLLEVRQVRVNLELAEPQYSLAVNAHRDGKTLRAVGTLIKEGRRHELKNARDVEIEEE